MAFDSTVVTLMVPKLVKKAKNDADGVHEKNDSEGDTETTKE